jgi:hypothetical protein
VLAEHLWAMRKRPACAARSQSPASNSVSNFYTAAAALHS